MMGVTESIVTVCVDAGIGGGYSTREARVHKLAEAKRWLNRIELIAYCI